MNKTIRDSLDQIVADALKPVSITLCVMYGILGVIHMMVLPSHKETMAMLAAASAVILLAIRLLLTYRPLQAKFAHPLAAVICSICMLNIFAHCMLVSDPSQPINLLFLMVGAGLIFTSLPWLLSIFFIGAFGWYILNVHLNLGLNSDSTSTFAMRLAISMVLALISYVTRVRTYIRLEKAKTELEELSLTDPLTGLCNRRAFNQIGEQQLKVASRSGIELALIYIDLDNMKPINDKLGHEIGDQALKELSTILTCNLRDSDLIARLGGDEFCVLLAGSEKEVGAALERVVFHVANRNTYNAENHYNLQFSSGTVFFDKDQHKNIDDMMKAADVKMYEAKRLRKNKEVA